MVDLFGLYHTYHEIFFIYFFYFLLDYFIVMKSKHYTTWKYSQTEHIWLLTRWSVRATDVIHARIFRCERKIIKICARYFPPIRCLLLFHRYDISNLESILSFIDSKVIDCNSASTHKKRDIAQTILFSKYLMCEL